MIRMKALECGQFADESMFAAPLIAIGSSTLHGGLYLD